MEAFLAILTKELGYGDDGPTRALAQELWDISQKVDRTPQEQARATWFVRTLNRARTH